MLTPSGGAVRPVADNPVGGHPLCSVGSTTFQTLPSIRVCESINISLCRYFPNTQAQTWDL